MERLRNEDTYSRRRKRVVQFLSRRSLHNLRSDRQYLRQHRHDPRRSPITPDNPMRTHARASAPTTNPRRPCFVPRGARLRALRRSPNREALFVQAPSFSAGDRSAGAQSSKAQGSGSRPEVSASFDSIASILRSSAATVISTVVACIFGQI